MFWKFRNNVCAKDSGLEHRKRIGYHLIKLFVCFSAPVKLMIDLAVLYEQNAVGMACRLYRVSYHKHRLTGGIDTSEQTKQLVRRRLVKRAGGLVCQ